MDAGNIKGALLVPVTGMAIDKVIALSGDTTAHPESEPEHPTGGYCCTI
jgi:hypothetical protein